VGEHLLLKWGTLKGWDVGENVTALAAVERYHEGPTSWGAMQQRDSATQKQAICDLIDAIDGPITNDWSGEKMTKDEAKAYVMEYKR
jgi:hypothetical protein